MMSPDLAAHDPVDGAAHEPAAAAPDSLPIGAPPATAPSHDRLQEPLRIGSLELDRRVFMAPMAGISTPAFRRSVRRFGAGLVYTEMIRPTACTTTTGARSTISTAATSSIRSLSSCSAPTRTCLPTPPPCCVRAGADLVDLNMACPCAR